MQILWIIYLLICLKKEKIGAVSGKRWWPILRAGCVPRANGLGLLDRGSLWWTTKSFNSLSMGDKSSHDHYEITGSRLNLTDELRS